MRVLRGHRGNILCLLSLGHLLISGARDNTIRYGLGTLCCDYMGGQHNQAGGWVILSCCEYGGTIQSGTRWVLCAAEILSRALMRDIFT